MASSDLQRFVALAFCRADVVFEIDRLNTVVFVAGTTPACFGRTTEDIRGKPFLDLIAPRDRQLVAEIFASARRRGRIDDIVVQLSGSGGRPLPAAIAGYPVPDCHDNIYLGLKVSPPPITLPRPDDTLKMDAESGLLDQASFATAAAERVCAYPRAGGEAQVTLLKLGHVTTLTDKLPPSEKTRFLTKVGRILNAASLGGNMAGRLASDAFGYVHIRGIDAETINRKIEEAARQTHPEGANVDSRSVTLGAQTSAMTEDQVARAIIHTMQQFCRSDGCVKAADLSEALPSMMSETFDRIKYVKMVTRQSHFDLVFMPICDLKDGKVHHFEALTRFRDTVAGVSPYSLISLAEEVDIIRDFDTAIVMKAIQMIADFNRESPIPPIAVNISGASIAHFGFVNKLHQLLATDRLLPERLMLEITESARIERLVEVNRAIQTFRRKGFKVCVDDFGAGGASFDYLHMLDVDIVKFDGPVLKRACSSDKGRDMLGSMVRMCRDMRVTTVAEMVEDRRIAAQALECGVDFGQGYYFGKPRPDPFAFAGRFADSGTKQFS
ncbi:MAG: EAL domain-containing protein [Alphaproteobacteria bacterium]